jgi:hypothetical protein
VHGLDVAAVDDDENKGKKDSEGLALWRRTIEELLAKGYKSAEAIEGANLILEAYKRQRAAESDTPVSHRRPSGEYTILSGVRNRRSTG